MKNKFVILVFILLMVCGCSLFKTDALRFKDEYESLNSVSVINVREDNPFVYKTQKDIQSLIEKKESFVVFYGNPKNRDTRNLIESIVDIARTNALGVIYYVESEENIPMMIGYIDGEEYLKGEDNDYIHDIISTVSVKLSSCNIETGC